MKKKKIIFLGLSIAILTLVLSCVGYCFNDYVNQYKIALKMVENQIYPSMEIVWKGLLPYYALCITSIILLSLSLIFLIYLLIKETVSYFKNGESVNLKSSRKAKKKAKLEKKLEELNEQEKKGE